MMRRLLMALLLASVACTEVATDPNAVVAIRFDGSAYPSIVAGDSLRDSLGTVQPLRATGLNYKGDPVAGAEFVFSSPDTILRVFDDGVVFARGKKGDAAPTRVFATSGSLQSQPDSLFVVPRADSIKAERDVDTIPLTPLGGSTPDTLRYRLFGDTLAKAPKAPVQAWLVSFQLRYHGALLPAGDTVKAYPFVIVGTGTNSRRVPSFVDSTDATGTAQVRVWVQAISTTASEDTIFLVATARARKTGADPIKAETMILIRRQ